MYDPYSEDGAVWSCYNGVINIRKKSRTKISMHINPNFSHRTITAKPSECNKLKSRIQLFTRHATLLSHCKFPSRFSCSFILIQLFTGHATLLILIQLGFDIHTLDNHTLSDLQRQWRIENSRQHSTEWKLPDFEQYSTVYASILHVTNTPVQSIMLTEKSFLQQNLAIECSKMPLLCASKAMMNKMEVRRMARASSKRRKITLEELRGFILRIARAML